MRILATENVDDIDWSPREGFLAVKVRAISARINQNFDAWPAEELRKSAHTFVGKPVFVNHANEDPSLARGKVVAARFVEAGDDKYIETIMEVDAQRFPKLAKEIIEGGIDSVSMGAEAGYTICSMPSCRRVAHDVPDMCEHVRYHKGEHLIDPMTKEATLVFEECKKIGFFELSFVFDPADETAVASKVIHASVDSPAYSYEGPDIDGPVDPHFDPNWDPVQEKDIPAKNRFRQWLDDTLSGKFLSDPKWTPKHAGENSFNTDDFHTYNNQHRTPEEIERDNRGYSPVGKGMVQDWETGEIYPDPRLKKAFGETEAPESVDTLRADHADSLDDEFHHYLDSPQELSDPDLSMTHRLDREQEQQGLDSARNVENVEGYTERGMESPGEIEDSDEDHPVIPVFNASTQNKGRGTYRRTVGKTRNATAFDDPGFGPWAESEYKKPLYPSDPDTGEDLSIDPRERGIDPDYLADGTPLPIFDSGAPKFLDDKDPTKLKKGNTMSRSGSLAQRGRVASQQRVRHYADDSGHTDGGPFNVTDQGEQEEVFITQVPAAEAVEVAGGDQISNTENNLVAKLNTQRKALEQTARQLAQYKRAVADGVDEVATTVNPPLSGTNTEEGQLKGDDFESANPNDGVVETQPKDASIHAFKAFDRWLAASNKNVTAAQVYANEKYIVRQAQKFASIHNVNPQVLFPTLGNVLRQAKKIEIEKRATMRRRADESLDVAAPEGRIDVEAPVKNVTDADAQASQFDKGDFGNNAGDGVADPDLSTDQNWTPGDKKEGSVKLADAVQALRLAENCIKVGLLDESDKYNAVSQFTKMRAAQVMDRAYLIEAILSTMPKKVASGSVRGTTQQLPQGISRGVTRSAAISKVAANDPANDIALWV